MSDAAERTTKSATLRGIHYSLAQTFAGRQICARVAETASRTDADAGFDGATNRLESASAAKTRNEG